ncbi:MAG: HNH endonuclease [bacterium]|nr:HNH endonuclease [bacterium]
MRPVDKGAAPALYAKYQDAGPDLLARLGDYCSYCERQVETHLAVEHVQPKVRRKSLENVWSNFLLGCIHCNSSKGKKRIAINGFFWPDRDNTLRAIEYVSGGVVQPKSTLNATERARAQETIALTGLDKYPGNPGANRPHPIGGGFGGTRFGKWRTRIVVSSWQMTRLPCEN